MALRKHAIGRGVIATTVIALILAALLGFVLVTSQTMVKTVTSAETVTHTETSTATPTQQVDNVVGGSFDRHLLLFTTRNVSAIVSQYESNANITWWNVECFSGIYSNQTTIALLMNFVFGYKLPTIGSPLAPHGFSVDNVTQTRIVSLANGSVLVNSTFGLAAQHAQGNFNATISAQDLYSYSETGGTWLISEESWHFLSSAIPPDVMCMVA